MNIIQANLSKGSMWRGSIGLGNINGALASVDVKCSQSSISRHRSLPKKANLAMTPVCLATRTDMPVSRKGTVNSTAFCRSELIFMELTITSARPLMISFISPFQVLFYMFVGPI